jgi:predicted  nucleic acid-binding Zn-ribbon protein
MTQRELLDSLLTEIKHIKTNMPNGELKQMARDFENVKEDLSDLKYTLLNPDNGVIVNTNKNTDFRKKIETGERDFQIQVMDVEELKRWKNGVNKALWILFTVVAGIIIRILMMHKGGL